MADLAARWPFLQAERMSAVRKLVRLHGSVGTGASLFVGVGFANSVSGVDGFVEGGVLLEGEGFGLEPAFAAAFLTGFVAEEGLESGEGGLVAGLGFAVVVGLAADLVGVVVVAGFGLDGDFGVAGFASVGPLFSVLVDVVPGASGFVAVLVALAESGLAVVELSSEVSFFGVAGGSGAAEASIASFSPTAAGEVALLPASTCFAAWTSALLLDFERAGALVSLSHAPRGEVKANIVARRKGVRRRRVIMLMVAIKHRAEPARKTQVVGWWCRSLHERRCACP